jgi:hypothetical protein
MFNCLADSWGRCSGFELEVRGGRNRRAVGDFRLVEPGDKGGEFGETRVFGECRAVRRWACLPRNGASMARRLTSSRWGAVLIYAIILSNLRALTLPAPFVGYPYRELKSGVDLGGDSGLEAGFERGRCGDWFPKRDESGRRGCRRRKRSGLESERQDRSVLAFECSSNGGFPSSAAKASCRERSGTSAWPERSWCCRTRCIAAIRSLLPGSFCRWRSTCGI